MIWWQGHRGRRRNSPSNVPPIAGMAAVELLVQPRSFPGISTSVGCDFREVWDANLKCWNMLKYVEICWNVTLRYPGGYPLISMVHFMGFCFITLHPQLLHPPSLGAPTPKLSSRARPQKRQAERWVDLRHEQTGSIGLSGSFFRVKDGQVISGSETWSNMAKHWSG